MHAGALRALEFDRIVSVVAGLAVTSPGEARLSDLHPMTDAPAVVSAQRATTEGARFLADHPGFPLRAPADLDTILQALGVEGRPLEPLRLLGLAEYLESVEQTRRTVRNVAESFPILAALVETIASFRGEIADVRRKIEPSGEVADNASPALASIRERLRRQKARLRSTLESFVRGRETAKYLQEQVVTDRNGRYVLMLRAEHRGAIPGIVHGGSASGASLFVEPMETVEINNEIVELEEQEADEVRRILLALTDNFRGRPADLARTIEVATQLDVVQARARFSLMTDGVEPIVSSDGSFELRGARHPLLMGRVRDRLEIEAWSDFSEAAPEKSDQASISPVPVDILLTPPVRVLVITGPNTGGKTVALKTAGLLAAMAQAGLHVPADKGSRLPIFKAVFADIGDEQSISASLSTFSAHITNVVSMDRDLALPSLVLLDEVGAGTDPVEGGALGTAVIDHFRMRGSHLIATTHYDSLKSYASTTPGVVSAAFGFNPETFAPTYQLIYGSPGRSLALEIALRLGMPASVIAAARANLTEREKQLAEHLARVDDDLRALQQERKQTSEQRMAMADAERRLRAREESVRQREETLRKRLDAKVDEQVRLARREIDTIIEGLKARAAELSEQAAVRLRSGDRMRPAGISTGDTGAARADARVALDAVLDRLQGRSEGRPVQEGEMRADGPRPQDGRRSTAQSDDAIEPGVRVVVGGLGLEGVVIDVHGRQAEVDVRGKRLRAALRDLSVIGHAGSAATAHGDQIAGGDGRGAGRAASSAEARRAKAEGRPAVHVTIGLQPRTGSLTELNVVGNTVDEALRRLEKFLDESTISDVGELRIVHGHGTGQLRRAIAAFLKEHPLVARFDAAPPNQGGGGATIVELKD
jgi:DNA mismatch repair protein MutS2